jgi:hypothetical protein
MMTWHRNCEGERGNEFYLDETQYVLLPMDWKLNETPLEVFHFVDTRWKEHETPFR